jgi:hypothetical protein
MKEYGRSLRLDDEAEKKLLAGAASCNWRKRSLQLFRDIIILMRDTGMRNERELYPMRIENLDWEGRVIFVPDSKTEEGRRRVPMSNRAFDILNARSGTKREGWVFPSKRAESAHLTTMAKRFREARRKAGLPEDLVSLLWEARFRNSDSEENRKPGCGYENHGTQGCEDCHAVSTSRTRDRARCARSRHNSGETGVAGLSYGTLYGTPKTSTPVSD